MLVLKADCEIELLPSEAWERCIREVIAVRTAAYEQWNGPKSKEEQLKEADAWLRRLTERKSPVLLVARRGEQTVGYLLGEQRPGSTFYVSHIGVLPDCQRQGIGRALLRRGEQAAREAGRAALATASYNRFKGMLILLFEEGFEVQRTTVAAGAAEPRLLFRKELT